MNSNHIDILNIGLIVISLAIAISIPFELFLFSYAILGPLHYLTEISWLQKKDYFLASNKKWAGFFILLAGLLAIYPLVKYSNIPLNHTLDNTFTILGHENKGLLLGVGFLFAIGLIYFKTVKTLVISLLVAILLVLVCITFVPSLFIMFTIVLPTLIHVYVFTFFFILYGAMKTKSKYGLWLAAVLLLVPLTIIFMPVDVFGYQPSAYTMQTFESSQMENVHRMVARLFNQIDNGEFLLLSETGVRIQIFIAFAYTYHYLNWFSKTSIIGWKKAITQRNALFIFIIWMAAVSLYLYDFTAGLIGLFLLSILHVLLEFPLNIISIKETLNLALRKRQ